MSLSEFEDVIAALRMQADSEARKSVNWLHGYHAGGEDALHFVLRLLKDVGYATTTTASAEAEPDTTGHQAA